MKGKWFGLKRDQEQGAAAPAVAEAAPGTPSERYLAAPARPRPELALRIGLWTAVGVGCVGGLVGLVRSGAGASEPEEVVPVDSSVPAPVTAMAELAVEEWLAATAEDTDRMDALFVDELDLTDVMAESLEVERVVAVAAGEQDEEYWSVTVSVDVVELVPTDEPPEDDGTGTAPAEEDLERTDEGEYLVEEAATWYVEVGIVGDPGEGLAALTTPAIVPPPRAEDGWSAQGERKQEPEADDPLVESVNGFLEALLLGADPDRYLTPGFQVEVLGAEQFVDVELEGMAEEVLEDGGVMVWAQVMATTPGGANQRLAYEMILDRRDGRWEVSGFWGTPSLASSPVPEGEEAATDG